MSLSGSCARAARKSSRALSPWFPLSLPLSSARCARDKVSLNSVRGSQARRRSCQCQAAPAPSRRTTIAIAARAPPREPRVRRRWPEPPPRSARIVSPSSAATIWSRRPIFGSARSRIASAGSGDGTADTNVSAGVDSRRNEVGVPISSGKAPSCMRPLDLGDRRGDIVAGLEAVLRLLGQQPGHQGLQHAEAVGQLRHRLGDVHDTDRERIVGVVRHAADQHLEQHDAEAVEVRTAVDLLAARLLRAHVVRRADDRAGPWSCAASNRARARYRSRSTRPNRRRAAECCPA